MIDWKKTNEQTWVGTDNSKSFGFFGGCVMVCFGIITFVVGLGTILVSGILIGLLQPTFFFGLGFLAGSLLLWVNLFSIGIARGKPRTIEISLFGKTLKISTFNIEIPLESISEIRIFKLLERNQAQNNKTRHYSYFAFLVLRDGSHHWVSTAFNRENLINDIKTLIDVLNLPVQDLCDVKEETNVPLPTSLNDAGLIHNKMFLKNNLHPWIESKPLQSGRWFNVKAPNTKKTIVNKAIASLFLFSILGFLVTFFATDSIPVVLGVPFALIFFGILSTLFAVLLIFSQKQYSVLKLPHQIEIYKWYNVKFLRQGHVQKIEVPIRDIAGVQVHSFPNDLIITLQTSTDQSGFNTFFIDRVSHHILSYWQPSTRWLVLWHNSEGWFSYADFLGLSEKLKN